MFGCFAKLSWLVRNEYHNRGTASVLNIALVKRPSMSEIV